MAKPLPKQTRAVIVGGGIVGCSVAYHLTKLGWSEVVLLEQGQISSGDGGMIGSGIESLVEVFLD